MRPDIAEQIRVEQVAALAVIRRVAESLPGFTFVEIGGRMSEGAPMLVASDTPSDTSRRSNRETCCEPV